MRYIGRIIRGTKSRIEKKVKGIKLKSQNQIVIFINCLTKSSISVTNASWIVNSNASATHLFVISI